MISSKTEDTRHSSVFIFDDNLYHNKAVWIVEFSHLVNCYLVQRRPMLILGRSGSHVQSLNEYVADPTWEQSVISTR